MRDKNKSNEHKGKTFGKQCKSVEKCGQTNKSQPAEGGPGWEVGRCGAGAQRKAKNEQG